MNSSQSPSLNEKKPSFQAHAHLALSTPQSVGSQTQSPPQLLRREETSQNRLSGEFRRSRSRLSSGTSQSPEDKLSRTPTGRRTNFERLSNGSGAPYPVSSASNVYNTNGNSNNATPLLVRGEDDREEGWCIKVAQVDGVITIPLHKLVGLAFDVYHEKARESALGQVVIVQTTETMPKSERIAWLILSLVTLAMAIGALRLLGPWSCVFVLATWLVDLGRASAPIGPHRAWLGPRALTMTSLVVAWGVSTFLLPLLYTLKGGRQKHGLYSGLNEQSMLSSVDGLHVGDITSSGVGPAIAYSVAAVALTPLVLRAVCVCSGGKWSTGTTKGWYSMVNASDWYSILWNICVGSGSIGKWRGWIRRGVVWRPPPLPRPVSPIVVRFVQSDIGAMLEFRSQLWQNPQTRRLVTDVWVGGSTTEAALSLLPSELYGSGTLRWAMHILLDYFLPMYTVLQGLGALVPFVGSKIAILALRVKGDGGVRIALAVIQMHLSIAVSAVTSLKSAVHGVTVWVLAQLHVAVVLSRIISALKGWILVLVAPLRSILSMCSSVGQAILTAIGYMNTAIKRFLVPSDYIFVYIQAKIVPARLVLQSWARLAQPLFAACREAADALWKVLTMLAAPLSRMLATVGGTVAASAETIRVFVVALASGARAFSQEMKAAGLHAWGVIKWGIFRPVAAPSMAQVGKKVADEGNRLARYVSIKRLGTNNNIDTRYGPASPNAIHLIPSPGKRMHRFSLDSADPMQDSFVISSNSSLVAWKQSEGQDDHLPVYSSRRATVSTDLRQQFEAESSTNGLSSGFSGGGLVKSRVRRNSDGDSVMNAPNACIRQRGVEGWELLPAATVEEVFIENSEAPHVLHNGNSHVNGRESDSRQDSRESTIHSNGSNTRVEDR